MFPNPQVALRADPKFARQIQPAVRRDADPLTFDPDVPTLYGPDGDGGPLFDLCAGDSLMALSLAGRTAELIDWIGVETTNVHKIKELFIGYVAADGTGEGTPSPGWISDPCAPGNKSEWTTCDWEIEGFGEYRRGSETRNIVKDYLRFCVTQPTYRVNGTRIMDELEWDYWRAGSNLSIDMAQQVISGNKSTTGQMDGLARLIKYGYTNASGNSCPAMDSQVVNYNGNLLSPVNSNAGVTYNGAAWTNAPGLLDIIRFTVRRVRNRIRMANLGRSPIQPGDLAIVMPFEFISCLLDAWTCWFICAGDFTRLQSYEARQYRQTLEGGFFGYGVLRNVDGIDIPILAHDYEMINEDGTFNMFILIKQLNGQPVIRMQTLDMTGVTRDNPYYTQLTVTDGQRFLSWVNRDNTCRTLQVEIDPRLLVRAPWAQISIQNIACNDQPNVISEDPNSPFFFGLGGDLRSAA